MAWSAYETLYKGLMNINEDSCQPWGIALALVVIGVCEIPQQVIEINVVYYDLLLLNHKLWLNNCVLKKYVKLIYQGPFSWVYVVCREYHLPSGVNALLSSTIYWSLFFIVGVLDYGVGHEGFYSALAVLYIISAI